MTYTVWIANYSNEQLMPQFSWLWVAKMYARSTSKSHPGYTVEVLDDANHIEASYKDGEQIY